MRFFLLSCLGLGPFFLISQTVPHDLCEQALGLIPNQAMVIQNNEFASTTDGQIPSPAPGTCIRTFENDLWYEFATDESYEAYEILVDPISCETPAGLQALIIRSDDCSSETYEYVACVNPYAVEQLTLWLIDSVPGRKYYVYVDGFDGNICQFAIQLNAYASDPRDADHFRIQQIDYSEPVEMFELENQTLTALNNEIVLTWTTDNQQDLNSFLIQAVHQTVFGTHGELLGVLEPRQTVGIDQSVEYQFVDKRPLQDGETYCYRLVRLMANGDRAYSEMSCVEAQINEEFFISPVVSVEGRTYAIQFRNHRRQDLDFQVLTMEKEELKSMTRAKEPKGFGTITIDMSEYDPGTYYLKVIGKSEFFLRMFLVE